MKKVTEEFSNLLDVTEGIICHQVNCLGRMKSGLAKSISEKYPIVKEKYDEMFFHIENNTVKSDLYVSSNLISTEIIPSDFVSLLGYVQLLDVGNNLYVANLFGQYDYGTDSRKTEYFALKTALERVQEWESLRTLFAVTHPVYYNDDSSPPMKVHLPKNLGCGLAGGDWKIVRQIIENVFHEGQEVECVIHDYGN